MIYPLKNPPRTHPVHLTFVESVRRRSNKDGNVHWGAIPLGGGGRKANPGGKTQTNPVLSRAFERLDYVSMKYFVAAAIFRIRLTVQLLPCISGSINRW